MRGCTRNTQGDAEHWEEGDGIPKKDMQEETENFSVCIWGQPVGFFGEKNALFDTFGEFPFAGKKEVGLFISKN